MPVRRPPPSPPEDVLNADRLRGALIGLAIGDALGTTLEFQPPGTFEPLTDMVGGGVHRLKPGQWTDDTSMALCLAESLLARGGMDAADQMRRYVRWYREGHLSSTNRCFDVGNQTRAALERFERTGEPHADDPDPSRSGNGSIMRLAPVSVFFAAEPHTALDACAESSRTTHASPLCIDACRLLGALVLGALDGRPKEEILAPGFNPVPEYWDKHPLAPAVREVAEGSFRTKQPPDIRGTGYVVQSLEAALWAFHHARDFRDGALAAVNLGDDADTTGAVYGQLAGAFFGERAIPADWRAKLALWPTLDRIAEGLAANAMKR